jgi:hypothetical protein
MSIRAPSPLSRRSASSIVNWTTASGSRAPEIRVPSSRSDRSTTAWRSPARRDRSSSAIRRALAIANAACSASERTSAIWGALKASGRRENVPSAPNTSVPATSGATTRERSPTSSTNRSGPSTWVKDTSSAYSFVTTTRRSDTALPNIPVPTWSRSSRIQ